MNYRHISEYFCTPSAESLAYRNHVIEITPFENDKPNETLKQTIEKLILRWDTKTNDVIEDAIYDTTPCKSSDTGKGLCPSSCTL